MKKYLLIFLGIILLFSCESKENKDSRLILDKYVRKLNSMTIDIISSREEEGSQSRITLNQFYDRYTSKLEDFNNDIDFESISEKYNQPRENLVSLSRSYYDYLNSRKRSVINLSEAFSSYESAINAEKEYQEYKLEMSTTRYSYDLYSSMATSSASRKFEESLEFIDNKYSYLEGLIRMDSITEFIDSISTIYNGGLQNLKLIEGIKTPIELQDSINDWLLSNKMFLEELDVNDK